MSFVDFHGMFGFRARFAVELHVSDSTWYRLGIKGLSCNPNCMQKTTLTLISQSLSIAMHFGKHSFMMLSDNIKGQLSFSKRDKKQMKGYFCEKSMDLWEPKH